MKYLKLFESTLDELEDLVRSKINYDMIDDLCDMALDYVDGGYKLYIVLSISTSHQNRHTLMYFSFNHDVREFAMERGISGVDFLINELKLNKLTYFIQLASRIGYTKKSTSLCKELIDRAKEAYPDENIDTIIYKT